MAITAGRLRPYAWMMMVVSILVSAYSFLAVVMVASMSGAPNYALDRARYNARVWTAATVVSLLFAIGCIVFLLRTRRRS